MDIKTVPQPPCSPDLAPCDFWLFHKLRGCRHETIEEMKEAVTKAIDTLTQEVFHRAFQKLLEWYNKFVATGGDYLEGEFHVCTINKSAHTKKNVCLKIDLVSRPEGFEPYIHLILNSEVSFSKICCCIGMIYPLQEEEDKGSCLSQVKCEYLLTFHSWIYARGMYLLNTTLILSQVVWWVQYFFNHHFKAVNLSLE